MNSFFKILFIFLSYFVFIPNANLSALFINASNKVEFNLDQELNKGNILLGIKQHIGREAGDLIGNQLLLFKTEKNFLELTSSNGITHKSDELRITFKRVLLDSPLITKRIVIGPFASYESAYKQANILEQEGYETEIAFPENWEVWLPADIELPEAIDYQVVKQIKKYELIPFLENNYNSYKLEGPISINSNEDIKINHKNYGTDFFLIKDSYGTWTLVQQLSFDKYLEGVLPHEIGANAPFEALKAQAVIARTWAFYNANRFKIDKYHLCITTQCQVYKPSSSSDIISKAIFDTSNLILTYEDKPVNAFYHASNGGISALASESWQIENYPYFEPRFDFVDDFKTSMLLPLNDTAKLREFLEIDSKNFFGNEHHLFRWQKIITKDKIHQILVDHQLIQLNSEVVNIEIIERGISGRVVKLKVILQKPSTQIILLKDDIRKTLKFLPSNLFIIDNKNDNLLIFKGAGFGHGVGLSQSGAIEMAKSGFSYKQILDHYYQNTNIVNIEDLKN